MINRTELAARLTEKFIQYQWRLNNPFPHPPESHEVMHIAYRSDYMFKNKVDSMVSGVMRTVIEVEEFGHD